MPYDIFGRAIFPVQPVGFLDESPEGYGLKLEPCIGLEPLSKLLRTLLELLRLRRMRSSFGSTAEVKPPARANKTRISVKLTTPTRRPEMRAPGNDEAETLGPEGAMKGVFGEESTTVVPEGSEGVDVADGVVAYDEDTEEEWLDVGTSVADCRDGVGGPEELGDTGSVIHMR